jgi:hypothetical protein
LIEFIIAAFLYAKLKKKYILTPLFQEWYIYLPLLFAGFYIFLEITIWARWYYFLPYQQIIKTATLLSYLPLIIRYQLFAPINNKIKNEWLGLLISPMVIGISCIVLGIILNSIAIQWNNGYMPIFPSLTIATGYLTREIINDGMHILGGFDTKVIPLSDWIDTGFFIASPGDILVRLYAFITIYFSIKFVNINKIIIDKKQKEC